MYKLFDWKNEIKENELNEVIDILNENGIIIFPTETVYGIGGNATSGEVVEKVYLAKHRPRAKAVNILVKNRNEIEKYAQITSDVERKIIDAFMPGPITIILKKNDGFGEGFTQEDNTIGVRIPDNKIALAILKNFKNPLAVTSANKSGKTSGLEVADFIDVFNNQIDIIIDGGKTPIGVSSTIVKVKEDKIKILRQGNLEIEE